MKYIALISVIGMILLQFSGAVPQSSVGGPLTLALGFFCAAVAVGIHEAWTKKRGVLGWVLSIVVSLVGAFLAAELSDLVILPILMLLSLGGSLVPLGGPLVTTGGPLIYVALAGMTLYLLLGSWGALWFVSRWR